MRIQASLLLCQDIFSIKKNPKIHLPPTFQPVGMFALETKVCTYLMVVTSKKSDLLS